MKLMVIKTASQRSWRPLEPVVFQSDDDHAKFFLMHVGALS